LGAPLIFDELFAGGGLREQEARVAHIDGVRRIAQTGRPSGIGTADQQRTPKPALNQRNPVEAVSEHPLEQETLRTCTGRSIAPLRAQIHVEQCRHKPLVRWPGSGDKTT